MGLSELSEWLERMLKERRMNKRELAQKAHLDPGIITRAIKMQRMPGNNSLKAIASALECSEETIFHVAGVLNKVTIQQATLDELSNIISQLPPDQVDELIEIGRMKVKNARKLLSRKNE